jgi:valyl-tRNA synthetase
LFPVHILINTQEHLPLVQSHLHNIKVLSLVNKVVIHTNESEFNQQSFVAKSTAGHDCTFGIVVTSRCDNTEINNKINMKKLQKLEIDLEKLLKTISNEGYAQMAPEKTQKRHVEKVILDMECVHVDMISFCFVSADSESSCRN